jgi:hypothetical protein
VNPFAVLGLPASPYLDDARVREAWRQAAAGTHPDRPDGGDPAAYAAAAAAYGQLRTAWGRSEALADLSDADGIPRPPPPLPPTAGPWRAFRTLPARVRHGRPARLALRAAIAVTVALLAQVLTGGTPSAPAVTAGAVLWLALTCRGDLAPPPGR